MVALGVTFRGEGTQDAGRAGVIPQEGVPHGENWLLVVWP